MNLNLNPDYEKILSKPINLVDNLFMKVAKINEFYNALNPDASEEECKQSINFLLGGIEHMVQTLENKNSELCDDYIKLLKWNLSHDDADELDNFYSMIKEVERRATE
jgi:hypothetical protein